MDLLRLDEWKARAAAGEPGPALLRKAFVVEVRAADGSDDEHCEVMLTTGSVDRERDTIAPDGWRVENFLKNPVVLFGHDYRGLPVGRITRLERVDNGLRGMIEFMPPGMHAFADTVRAMVKAGFLNAVSVGFAPLKWAYNEVRGGVDFLEQELLELSWVPVPANAEALVMARGLDPAAKAYAEQVRAWAASVLSESPEPSLAESITALTADIARLRDEFAALAASVHEGVAALRAPTVLTLDEPDDVIGATIVEDDEPTIAATEVDALLRETVGQALGGRLDALTEAVTRRAVMALTGRVD